MDESKHIIPKTDIPPKGEPPPRDIKNVGDIIDNDILLLTDIYPKGEPPPRTDMFFSNRELLRSNLLDSLMLGIAIGLSWGIMFIIISIAGVIAGGKILDFSNLIYPNFNTSVALALIIGFALSFLYAFIFGIIVGILYNSLVRRQIIEQEGWETYS